MELLIPIVFAAYVIRVLTGFGSVILLSPILSLYCPPKEAVVLVVLMESFVNVLFFLGEKLNFSLREIYLGIPAGVLAGTLLFSILPNRIVGIFIGTSLALISLLLLLEFRFKVEKEKALFAFSGFLSGLLGVITGVTGPQVVVALVNQGYDPKFVRSFMISFLSVVYTVILFSFILSGQLSEEVFSKLLKFVPAILLAFILGKRVVGRIEVGRLEKATLLVVLASSLSVIAKYSLT